MAAAVASFPSGFVSSAADPLIWLVVRPDVRRGDFRSRRSDRLVIDQRGWKPSGATRQGIHTRIAQPCRVMGYREAEFVATLAL